VPVPARGAILLAAALHAATASVGAQGSRPEEDLARLRRVASGPHPPSASQLARELDHVALAFLERGEIGRAIELFSEASERDPGSGAVLAHLALAYVRNGDFEFGRGTLDLAASIPDAPAALFCEIGSLYAEAHRLDDAMAAWESCRRLGGPTASFAGPLEAARAELSVMGRTRSLEADRFTIIADARIPEDLLRHVGNHLTAEDSRPDAVLRSVASSPQVVVLYAGRSFFTLVSIPDWVSGVFDGKIRIAVDPASPLTPALQSVLTHELTHSTVRELSRDRAPGWLHEGLAQWSEGRRLPREELRKMFARHSLVPLRDLEASFVRSDFEAARASYAEGLGLVEFLLEQRGPGAIVCVLADLAAGSTIDSALSAETGWDATTLLEAWARSAGLRGSAPAGSK
jgi:tetratricopeptide (TPR) repeat protein